MKRNILRKVYQNEFQEPQGQDRPRVWESKPYSGGAKAKVESPGYQDIPIPGEGRLGPDAAPTRQETQEAAPQARSQPDSGVSQDLDILTQNMGRLVNAIQNDLPKAIAEQLAPVINPGKHPDSPYMQGVLSKDYSPDYGYYKTVTLDLTVARDEEIIYTGPRTFIAFITVEDEIEVRIGSEDAQKINPSLFMGIKTVPFDRIYVTNPASSAVSANAVFVVGSAGMVEPRSATFLAKASDPAGLQVYPATDALKYLNSDTTDQDLTAAALDYTTSFSEQYSLYSVKLHSSVGINETVQVHWVSKDGANYKTLLAEEAMGGSQDFVYITGSKVGVVCREGDEIQITCTNGGGAGHVYVTFIVGIRS